MFDILSVKTRWFDETADARGWVDPDVIGAAVPAAALDISFTTGTLDPRVTFTRASTATYYNSSGLVTSAASGAPRFDYDPATLTARGLLLEDQSNNQLLYSGAMDNAVWAGGATGSGTQSRTANAGTAPDGTTTATLATVNRPGGEWAYAFSGQFTSVSAVQGVCSVYLKAYSPADVGKTVDLIIWIGAGVNAGNKIVTLTNNWVRYEVSTSNFGAALVQFIIGYAGVGGNPQTGQTQFLAWGGQAESGVAVATSYIPTTTTAGTRAADTASMTGTNFSSWYNASEGTFVVSLDLAAVTAGYHFLNAFQAASATANRMVLYGEATQFADYIADSVNGATKNNTLFAPPATGLAKLALAFKTNDAAGCCNATSVAADALVTVPTVDSLNIGRSEVGGSLTNGWFNRLTFYNTRKTNVELQALTQLPLVGTGTLVAQSATAASATARSASVSTAGTLAATAATVASTAGVVRWLSTAGALTSQSAAAASTTGIGASVAAAGVLAAQSATAASTTARSASVSTAAVISAGTATVVSTAGVVRTASTAGTLAAQSATAASTGISSSLSSVATPAASAATVVSTGGVVRSTTVSATLAAQTSAVASTTGVSRSSSTVGVLAPQPASIVGLGGGAGILGTGVLNVAPATATGLGLSSVSGTGVLQAVAGVVTGASFAEWIGTGALFTGTGTITGLGDIPYNAPVSGPYIHLGNLWEGAVAWGKVAGKWRRIRVWANTAQGWGIASWTPATQEVPVIVPAVVEAPPRPPPQLTLVPWESPPVVAPRVAEGTGALVAGSAHVTNSNSISGVSSLTHGAWEDAPMWLKVNGKWRRTTMWTKVSSEWKRVA